MILQFDINDYLRPLLRWWWLLVAAAVVAATSSFIYTISQPDLFESQATILVGSSLQDPNPSGGEFSLTQQLADTYADIAKRAPIRQATMDALGLDSLPPYYVAQVPNRPVIQVVVRDVDPQRAYMVADELVRQIILAGPQGKDEQERDAFVNDQLAKMQISITETEEEIIRQSDEMLNLNSARELANKQVQISALESKLTTLRQNYAQLLATTQTGAVNALRVLEPAYLPRRPLDSDLPVNMAVAIAVALVLAASGAYLLEYLDNSLREADEVKKQLGLSLLGTVPEIDADEKSGNSKLIMLHNAPPPIVEAYRILRTNLQFVSVDRPLRLLLVSSPQPKDGKSLTAANLAVAMALAGKKVVLVDTDLHRPTQHRLFRLYNNIGVTTALLSEEIEVPQLLQPTLVPGLSVLTSGPLPPNPAELLSSKRMQEILTKLKEQADIVIIDSPPLVAVVDGTILAAEADGMLMVLRSGKTRRDAAKHALASLNQVRARVLGVVFNGLPARAAASYYNYGYYTYAYRRGTNDHARSTGRQDSGAPGTPAAPLPSAAAPAARQTSVYELGEEGGNIAARPMRNTEHAPSSESSVSKRRAQSALEYTNGAPRTVPGEKRRSGLPWR